MNKELNPSQRKALGKGLSALLPPRSSGITPQAVVDTVRATLVANAPSAPLPESFESFETIPLAQISPNQDQPRGSWDMERLEELAQSIRANGLIQPITVSKLGPQKYSLIAGERRWRAARIAGLAEIPALVRTVEQSRVLELALIENIQREDLNPIETAVAFARLIEQHKLSHEQLAERTGKDRSSVTNFLRLLKLPREVQEDLGRGDISMGHARALLGLPTPQAQRQAAQRVLDQRLSVRETERLVKELTAVKAANGTKEKGNGERVIDPNIRAAIEEMQAALGTKVRLVSRSGGAGKIEVEYYSQDDLDRIYSVIVKS
ncbi:MAG: ParB/RepB/Spo0J family partition protein [Acidobacteriota bacterium]|nr:ParB/RepB/Spo0J family partition protein [Acidobacteriota bacterium]